jgi:hypothetical protein
MTIAEINPSVEQPINAEDAKYIMLSRGAARRLMAAADIEDMSPVPQSEFDVLRANGVNSIGYVAMPPDMHVRGSIRV